MAPQGTSAFFHGCRVYKCNKKSGHATLVLVNLGPVVSSVLHETNISEEIINVVILYNS